MKPENRTAPEPVQKKPYTAPMLRVHGDVGEITKELGTRATDGFEGSVIDALDG